MTAEGTTQPRADCRTRRVEMRQARWFDVDIPVHFFSPATETWGIGRTRRVSRNVVVFLSSDAGFSVGDELRYLLLFPGIASKSGAVGLCRGRIVRSESVVVVTIDRCRLQTAASVRDSRDARTRRLIGLRQPELLPPLVCAPGATPVW